MPNANLDEKKLNQLFKQHADKDTIMRFILTSLKDELAHFPKFYNGVDAADGQSLVYDGLLKAIDTYDPSIARAKFSSYLFLILHQQFRNHLVYWKAGKRDSSKAVPLPDEDDRDNEEVKWELAKKAMKAPDLDAPLNYSLVVEQLLEKANDQQKEILTKILQGTSWKELKQEYGISKRKVQKWVRQLNPGLSL